MARSFRQPVQPDCIGNMFAELRNQAGYTVREAGRALEVSYPTIVDIEKGRRKPGIELFLKMLGFYGIDLFYYSQRKLPASIAEPAENSNE